LGCIHLSPAALVGYAIVGAWADSPNLARFVYCAGFLVSLIAGISCIKNWIQVRALATQAALVTQP
jgi:membrane protein required for beta-lactamase induction